MEEFLCRLNMFSAFGAELDLKWTSVAFPQDVLAAITLVEVDLEMKELQPAQGVTWGFLSAQWP